MKSEKISSVDARKQLFHNDLVGWLGGRGSDIKERVADDKTNVSQYEEILQNLKKEKNPDAVVSYLLDMDEQERASPRRIGRKAAKLIKEEVSTIRPHIAVLSPAVLLTERKRKELIARLERCENLPEDENEVFKKLKEPSVLKPPPRRRRSSLSPDRSLLSATNNSTAGNKAHSLSPQGDFQPKWEHFNTMRTRWRYLMPQVKVLAQDNNCLVPTTSTSYVKVNNIPLSGQYLDYKHFNSSVQAQQSRSLSHATRSMMLSRQAQQMLHNPALAKYASNVHIKQY
ncbi:hypothetical protein EON65_33830 [archaeon]|nr:MAG: hypothetical protein EON65_33830 [archaeon]